MPKDYDPNIDESKLVKNNDEIGRKFTAPDQSDEITALVNEYLKTGKGYNELLKIIYFQYACAVNFKWCISYEPTYYKDVAYPEVWYIKEDNNDKYYDGIYIMARYGDIETYDDYEAYARLHFSHDVYSDIMESTINAGGYCFRLWSGRGISTHEWDPVYSLLIDDGMIVLKETRTVYKYVDNDDGSSKLVPSDEKTVHYYIIEKESDGKWRWSKIYENFPVWDEYDTVIAEMNAR
ncbi:MAG TPA: hypothetical protein PLZ27_03005 [Bacillota bacterium]|nr:hypothetical protein [Clostridiales bacterium]HPU17620.1 hypothetical protein [Bacillota bacterium]